MSLLETIKEEIKKYKPDFWKQLSINRTFIREHPLEKMVNDLEDKASIGVSEKSYSLKLADSIVYAKNEHEDFFKKKWKIVVQTGDDYNNPVGTCGEFRALHILEQSGFCVSQIPEGKNETPDFSVTDRYGNEFYIEVFYTENEIRSPKKVKVIQRNRI